MAVCFLQYAWHLGCKQNPEMLNCQNLDLRNIEDYLNVNRKIAATLCNAHNTALPGL